MNGSRRIGVWREMAALLTLGSNGGKENSKILSFGSFRGAGVN
jgi:hypothetical protein